MAKTFLEKYLYWIAQGFLVVLLIGVSYGAVLDHKDREVCREAVREFESDMKEYVKFDALINEMPHPCYTNQSCLNIQCDW